MKNVPIGFEKENGVEIQMKTFQDSNRFIEFCQKNHSKIKSINYIDMEEQDFNDDNLDYMWTDIRLNKRRQQLLATKNKFMY